MDKFTATIESYKKAGRPYTQRIGKLIPTHIDTFMRSLKSGVSILDVGCAAGRDSFTFAKHGFRVTGIDLVPSFLREAKQKVPKGTFKIMDVSQVNFPEASFDAIWANAVLHHIPRSKMLKTLKSFWKILKPKGRLDIRVKMGKGSELISDQDAPGHKRLFVYYGKKSIAALVEKAGFCILGMPPVPDLQGRKSVLWVHVSAKK